MQIRINANMKTTKSATDTNRKGDDGPSLSNINPPTSAKTKDPIFPHNQKILVITPRMLLGRFRKKRAYTQTYCVVEMKTTRTINVWQYKDFGSVMIPN